MTPGSPSCDEMLTETTAKLVATLDVKDNAGGSESLRRNEFVWIDDALPDAATPQGDGPWDFVGRPDHPVYSGAWPCAAPPWVVNNDPSTMPGPSSGSARGIHYSLMRTRSPPTLPKELMLQWHTQGGWTHRAYWGENLIDSGRDGTPERLRIGDLPPAGPVDPARGAGGQDQDGQGTVIDGWAFTQHGGTLYWDKAGIETETPQDGQLYDSLSAWLRAVRGWRSAGLPEHIKKIVATERSRRSEAETRELRHYFIEHASPGPTRILEPLRSKLEQAERTASCSRRSLRRPWSFARRPARPNLRLCSIEANTITKGRRSSARVPAFLPPLPPALRPIDWAWPSG